MIADPVANVAVLLSFYIKEHMNDFRPQAEAKKIHSKNEFELCYMRHKYFRKVGYNPTEIEMRPYKGIVENMAKKTFYTYKNLFGMIGFEAEDLINIGQVHLVSFLGLFSLDKMPQKYTLFCGIYEKQNGEEPKSNDISNKNKANFTMFIKQRMEDVVRICRQKARNIKGMPTEEFYVYYGPNKPPKKARKLLDDHEKYGFKKLDIASFKCIKKKVKAKDGEVFKFAGYWYIAVPLEHRSLSLLDFAGAGLDPYDSIHNKTPEELLFYKQSQDEFLDKRTKFKSLSNYRKVAIIRNFIRKNKNNSLFKDEIAIARRLVKNMRT